MGDHDHAAPEEPVTSDPGIEPGQPSGPTNADQPSEPGTSTEPVEPGNPPEPDEPVAPHDDGRRLVQLSSTVPAVAAGHLAVGVLDARAVSLRGEAHVLLGQARQDAFGLLAGSDDRWLVCGVADGLGAEAYSAFGADAALRDGLAALAEQLDPGRDDEPDLEVAVGAAVDGTVRRAEELQVPPHAVSTTLVLAAVRAEPGLEERECLVVSVGDSHALVLRASGRWEYLTPFDPDLCENVVDAYLPEAPEGLVCTTAELAPGDVLVIATDGFTTPLGDGTSTLGRHLAERWQPKPRDLMAFMVDLTFPGHHDDRTVLAVWA